MCRCWPQPQVFWAHFSTPAIFRQRPGFSAHRDALMTKTDLTFPVFVQVLWIKQLKSFNSSLTVASFWHWAIASCATFLFSPHFDVLRDLLLKYHKCCDNTSQQLRRLFPQRFRYGNTENMLHLFGLENSATKRRNQLVYFDHEKCKFSLLVPSLHIRQQPVLVLC